MGQRGLTCYLGKGHRPQLLRYGKARRVAIPCPCELAWLLAVVFSGAVVEDGIILWRKLS